MKSVDGNIKFVAIEPTPRRSNGELDSVIHPSLHFTEQERVIDMKIGNRVKWRKSIATIIDLGGNMVYLQLDCNMVKWVNVGEVEIYKKE